MRKAMATFRSRGTIDLLQDKMVGRMIERGYDPDFARRCFDQIKGFGEYGFPESHAASFAHLVYVSSWIKCHYPAAFCAALAQFAADGVLRPGADRARCARAWGRGARGRRQSQRMGLHAGGRRAATGGAPRACARSTGCGSTPRRGSSRRAATCAYASVEELRNRAGLNVAAVERLAAADAFRSMTLDRRAALWDAKALKGAPICPCSPRPRRATRGGRPRSCGCPPCRWASMSSPITRPCDCR